MFRSRALSLTILALFLTSLACNAFAGKLEPIPPPPTTTVEENTAADPSDPAATVTVPALSNLIKGNLTVLVDLNVRSGPGVEYDRVGFLLKNDTVPVIGIHSDTGWWKIECPDIVSGSECWVSGGEQYTRAKDVEDVHEAEAPPTPTPVPPTLEEGLGILSFVDDGDLYALKLDINQNPPQPVSEALALTDSGNVLSLSISPDGRRIAFISGSTAGNNLNVVNIDGQGLLTLVSSTDLPLDGTQSSSDLSLLVDQIAWLPDSRSLAFNTVLINQDGPGAGSQEDLWIITLEGELTQPFPGGTGGGAFVLATNGQVLLSRSNNLARANIDGSNIDQFMQFDAINTASEYVYYPVPQYSGGGETRVAVPDAQPWEPGAWTTLWQIPVSGLAGQLGSLDRIMLHDPILWSPDGSRLAYIQQPEAQEESTMSRLLIADGKGINATPYAGGEMLKIHAWGSDNMSFLYSGDGFLAVGRENSPPVQILLDPGQRASDAQWIGSETFVVAVGFPENGLWELLGLNISGERVLLESVRGFEALFDIWQP